MESSFLLFYRQPCNPGGNSLESRNMWVREMRTTCIPFSFWMWQTNRWRLRINGPTSATRKTSSWFAPMLHSIEASPRTPISTPHTQTETTRSTEWPVPSSKPSWGLELPITSRLEWRTSTQCHRIRITGLWWLSETIPSKTTTKRAWASCSLMSISGTVSFCWFTRSSRRCDEPTRNWQRFVFRHVVVSI